MEKGKIVLCDTNILFDYFQKDERISKELDSLGFARLGLSSVSIAEAYLGMKKSEIRDTKELVRKFNVFHLDKQISQKFLALMFEFRDLIAIPDALIASTALVNNLELYTLNVRDFDFIKGIKFYKPKF